MNRQNAITALDQMDDQFRSTIFRWKAASWTRLLRQLFLDMQLDPCGKIVVEIGTGADGIGLFFSTLGNETISSDQNRRSVHAAKMLHSKWGEACSYLVADIRMLPLRSGTVDLIVMKSVLGGVYAHHGKDAAIMSLIEIYGALKEGGLCIILEQLEGDPLCRWLRHKKFPDRVWHYFRRKELHEMASSSLSGKFSRVETRCLALIGHMLEEELAHNHILVRLASKVDKLLEKVVRDDWKHLIGVVAVK